MRHTPKEIDGIHKLVERMHDAKSLDDWAEIIWDHLSFGNDKLHDSIGIFNLGPATDCVNLGTDHCQVEPETCYAYKAERYDSVLAYRRRQEFIWDCVPPELFANAFLRIVERKNKTVNFLRFNESGDIRHQGDVTRMDKVAEVLSKEGISTYTYTASDYLDFSEATNITINASNDRVENVDRQFIVVEHPEDVPEDGFICPWSDNDINCGECQACMHPEGDSDIYETLH